MDRRVTFNHRLLPYFLLAPQIAITLIFFVWPAAQALKQSMLIEDPFGLSSEFVWFENFAFVLSDPLYAKSILTTAIFSVLVAGLALSVALFLAAKADSIISGRMIYRTLLVWPYAVAPAIAGVLFLFMFNPRVGVLSSALVALGIDWNYLLNGNQAMALVVAASAWKQVSYNFLFFVAGMQAMPRSLIEAAAIDGAGPTYRFWTIIFPLLMPVTFFLLVINMIFAFFETFGVIEAVTQGGPAGATNILVYKVYRDGFVGLDLGSSAAQSVILMGIVIVLTVLQFRYVEKRVNY
ncbi:MAG: sn-glycerol-3-phosphate ABC transporter permease UgpA [Alphaproteobacteria bacterium]